MTIAAALRLRQRLLSSVAHFHTQHRDLWDWRVPLDVALDPLHRSATLRRLAGWPEPASVRTYLGGLP